ncbi:MAG: hypothetical protein CFH44_00631 [Proteobacteria bacterium]|nr:MAG: hypothetical protein CFH44_00631 [Pseudomonadota bacterium]
MKAFPNKRKNSTRSKDELFKTKNLNGLLKKEQRASERVKIKEVKSQDKTYYYTLGACVFMILLLSCLALFGGYQ